MKKTEKGILAVDITVNGKAAIIFEPVNGTVWMDRNELCELFGVYMNTLDDCLDSILEIESLHVNENCKFHRVVKGKKIVFEVMEVNLQIIISMAFRLEAENAHLLRKWFVDRMMGNNRLHIPIPNIDFNYSLN